MGDDVLIRYECVKAAIEMARTSPAQVDVMALAKMIYEWITGQKG
jgi:hypothetical protein